MEMRMKGGSRVLALTGALAVLILSGCKDDDSSVRSGSFPNLVASGDTTDTSTVLWARFTRKGEVAFECSTDPAFGTIAASETATITDPDQPVRVEITGLAAGTQYYYRAARGKVSAEGRFRTAPAPGALPGGLRFGASGDWRGELSPYPAVVNAPGRDLDFFVSLGDTIYADYRSPDLGLPQAATLEEFRIKHNEVYSERHGMNALAQLRASTSVLATIDDHEVTNDFAGGAPGASDARFAPCGSQYINECELFLNGMQAFQEYNPVEDLFYGPTGDPRTENKQKLYRVRTYGETAAVFILDARSFRDEELVLADPSDPIQVAIFLGQSFGTSRTMLGAQQVADLEADLLQAEVDGIVWKFVVVPEPIQNLGPVAAPDRFEGYAAERTEILRFIDVNGIRNVVFVSADVHGTLVNNLTYQVGPLDPQVPVPAFEITTGPVAYEKPFGPTVVETALAVGLITQQEYDSYLLLDRDGKDGFVQGLLDGLLALFGYDPVGIEPASGVNVTVPPLRSTWVATHVYGWTEFDINAATQDLTVTTYGIDWYSEADLAADPDGIAALSPSVVDRFTVAPN